MTTYSMHLFYTPPVLALMQRIDRIIASADLAAWRSLHESLSLVRPTPRWWNNSIRVESQPITQCSYYFPQSCPTWLLINSRTVAQSTASCGA